MKKNIHPIRNVSSRRSMERQFALHSIRVLNQHERANSSQFPFTNASWRVRGRLTLMSVQPANAVCSGHRHAIFGLRTSLSACLSLPRARGGPAPVIEYFSCHPTVAGWRMVLGAGSGGDTTSSLRSSRGQTLAVAFLISARWPSARTVTEPILLLGPRTSIKWRACSP